MAHADVASPVASVEERIGQCREQIDSIDLQLLHLISQRAQQSAEIGRIKQSLGLPVYQPGREEAILNRLLAQPRQVLGEQHVATIWRTLFRASREMQQAQTVAFLGPSGTYTEQAMSRYFGPAVNGVACDSIDNVFAALAAGQAERAVVPIENSTEGAVTRTVDLLVDAAQRISGEVVLSISHCLLSANGSLSGIDCILGHEQALAQCRQWLDMHMTGVKREAVASNAAAAQRAAVSNTCAAIAGEPAAQQYGLGIAARAIQDRHDNRTRFLVLGGAQPESTGHDRTSIVVQLRHTVGMLAGVFEALARRQVSVLWLEPRPQKTGRWAYRFLIDLFGHADDANVAAALDEVRSIAEDVLVLGSYRCASNYRPVSAADER